MTASQQGRKIQQTFLLEFVAGALRTAVPVALVAALGASDYGLFVSATTSALLVYHLGCAGIPLSCTYFTAARPGPATQRRLLLAALIASVAAVLVGLGPALIYQQQALPQLPGGLVVLSILMIPPLTLEASSLAILRGETRNPTAALLNTSRNLLMLLVVLSTVWSKLDLRVAIAASGGLGFIVVLPTILAKLRQEESQAEHSIISIRGLVSYALPSHIGALIAFLNYRIDLLIVASLCSPELTGVYGLFVTLAESLWFFSLVLSSILIADVAGEKSHDLAWFRTARTTRLVFGGCAALLLVTMPALPFVLSLVLPAHGQLWPVLAIALASALVLTPSRLLATHRAARGAPQANLWASAVGVVINVICTVTLVPIWGLLGAAVGTLIAYLLICAERIHWFLRTAPTGEPAGLREVLIPTREDLKLVKREISAFIVRPLQ